VATGDFLVKSAQEKTTRGGKAYLNLVLAFIGGDEVPAKVWSEGIGVPVSAGDVINCFYEESTYDGKPQITIERYTLRKADFDRKQFRAATDIDPEETYEFLFKHHWQNESLNAFFRQLCKGFDDTPSLRQKLFSVPAGMKNHHARTAGLLQHVKEMWDLAEKLLDGGLPHFPGLIDREVLLPSIVMHDLGKIHEYDAETLLWEETRTLAYFGHSAWGVLLIEQFWPSEGKELKQKIQHCVLSHHGKLEFGAAVQPKLPEAVVLNLVDALSARLDVMRNAAKLPQGQKPDWSQTLGGIVPITETWPK